MLKQPRVRVILHRRKPKFCRQNFPLFLSIILALLVIFILELKNNRDQKQIVNIKIETVKQNEIPHDKLISSNSASTSTPTTPFRTYNSFNNISSQNNFDRQSKFGRNYYDFDDNLEMLSKRIQILQENRDEFLEEVLKEIQFIEIDLSKYLGEVSEYDKEIQIELQSIEPGLGENGKPVLREIEEEKIVQETIKKEAFNLLLSNRIALNRSVPDTRESACSFINYNINNLPSMSVIIVFHNEPFTTFMRTLHSIFNRTPRKVLQEVVLVDDFSDRQELKGQLERYLATRFSMRKIRLIRLSERAGLIRARIIGAHMATGDVLMFLDAHTEAVIHWAEPLLQRIKEKRTAVVSPIIDVISPRTFEYFNANREHFYIGGFTWSGDFTWISIPSHEQKRKGYHHAPTRTPIICGGLFAIERKYFWEIGSYDPGMKIWGAENLELSFRIWQCGGSVEIIPCSRFGHVFREFQPYSFPNNKSTFYTNTARLAKVWMDEYQNLYFMQEPINLKNMNIGDINKRIAFRERKQCKSFQWYLDTVYKEKFRMQFDTTRWGQFKNPITNQCLDDTSHLTEFKPNTLKLWDCNDKISESQTFFLSKKNQLRREEGCAVAVKGEDSSSILMEHCGRVDQTEWWKYDENHTLFNNRVGKCLTVREDKKVKDNYVVVLETCSNSLMNISVYQKWEILKSPWKVKKMRRKQTKHAPYH